MSEAQSSALSVAELAPARLRQLLNRELSWLDFDRRVLELAADSTLPLLDRVRYCAIASSNLDEFFAVRMGELEDQAATGVTQRSADGRTPAQVLADTRRSVLSLQESQGTLWRETLQPALAGAGIPIRGTADCRPRELKSLNKRFEREILPLLTPIAVDRDEPLPHLHSLSLNVCAVVDTRLICVAVPQQTTRFLQAGARGARVPVEDVVVAALPDLVGGDIKGYGVIRVTRDADVSVAADAADLLEALESELRRRRFGEVVRLEVGSGIPGDVTQLLARKLGLRSGQIYETRAPLGLADVAELAALDRPDLKRKRWRPATPRPFTARGTSLLAQIRRRDLLAHHPYDAYDSSVESFVAASHDPKVATLKATVYRTGKPSRTLSSLVHAAEHGKDAVCLVELRARFDELRNIEWSRALHRAGVHVVYGAPDFKIHAKLCLLVRRERGGLRRYVHIGTGNYHASNASTYEDLSLFTADEEIAADVADVFNAITGHSLPTVFRKLLVGPWFLREGVLHEIQQVAKAAEAGEPAAIRIKVNALVDPEVVEALYAASAAGATVEIITRGICVLRPGIPGLSERITVRSVLGPFLEHSRILSFRAGDRVSTWIGSADLMPRNLDRRVEVLAPVEDARLRARISRMLDALLADTRFAWELVPDGSWNRVGSGSGKAPRSAQEVLMQQALARAKKSR